MYAPDSTTPTPAIARLIQFVRQFQERYGYPPSGSDMARALRLERSWCSRVARQAVARGLLINDPGIARSWRLPPATGATPTSSTRSQPRRT